MNDRVNLFICIMGTIAAILTVLKLTGIIACAWILILMPVWGTFTLFIIMFIVEFVEYAITYMVRKMNIGD